MYAVYGTLRKGNGNHFILRDSKYLGTIRTPPMFTLMDMGAFPAVVPGESEVVVEIYEVDEKTEQRLFALEGYSPNRLRNMYGVSTFKSEVGLVNIFTMTKEQVVGYEEITSGDWVKYIKTKVTDKWKHLSIVE